MGLTRLMSRRSRIIISYCGPSFSRITKVIKNNNSNTGNNNSDNNNTTIITFAIIIITMASSSSLSLSLSPKSPSSSESRRQLVRPSIHVPWGVQVVSLVPTSVHDVLDSVVSGAVMDGWAAVALPQGRIHAYPIKTSTLSQDLQAAERGHTLYHPSLSTGKNSSSNNNENTDTEPQQQQVLVALSSEATHTFVRVYAAHPNGLVCMWRLGAAANDPPQLLPRSYQARIRLSPLEEGETITCLSGIPLVVGTSLGRLFWLTQTTRPVALHAQPMERNQSSTTTSSSFLNRITSYMSASYYTANQEPIHDILHLAAPSKGIKVGGSGAKSTCFLSVSLKGTIEYWKATTTVASSHKADFEAFSLLSLSEALQKQPHVPNVHDVTVLRATTLPHDGDNGDTDDSSSGSVHSLNFVVSLTVQENNTTAPETRLYWLQALLKEDTDIDMMNTNTEQQSVDGNTNAITFTLQHAIWLNRFHGSSNIACVGLVTTHEHITYAAFQDNHNRGSSSIPVTVMALLDGSTVVHEVDLPPAQAPRLVAGTLYRDVVTHGWCSLATSGLGLRGRWTGMQLEATSATPARKRGNPVNILSLTSHMRSSFWHWYQQQQQQQQQSSSSSQTASSSSLDGGGTNPNLLLPPSLFTASAQDLELAIIGTAQQLQHEGNSSSLHNPMEWHISLVELLQQGGLYRSLFHEGRFALLGIGQELAVHQRLAQAAAHSQLSMPLSQQEILASVQPHGVAEWLQHLQQGALQLQMQTGRGSLDGEETNVCVWNQWLTLALETAMMYRHERSGPLYDVVSSSSVEDMKPSAAASRLWTCHPTLQEIMLQQLNFYRDAIATNNKNNNKVNVVDTDALLILVEVALMSFLESRKSDSGNENKGQERYDTIKQLGIPLLRQVLPDGDGDAVAFDLAVKHHYYEGLCQIARQYESKNDNDDDSTKQLYDLGALMEEGHSLAEGKDHRTGLSFPHYVLQWHADRGLYAHVLNYGRYCPQLLTIFLQNDDRLRPYQWIPALRQNKYNDAAQCLLQNVQAQKLPESSSSSLSSTRWALSLGKLSNRLFQMEQRGGVSDAGSSTSTTTTTAATMERESTAATKRQKTIENQLELVQAQELLLEHQESSDSTTQQTPLLSPEKLLSIAMDQLEGVDEGNANESVQLCLIGLAICRSMDDNNNTNDVDNSQHDHHARSRRIVAASQVWAKSLLVDMSSTWMKLIQSQHTMPKEALKEAILESTVFGRLVQQYHQSSSGDLSDSVAYDERMEQQVLEHLGLGAVTSIEMKRLLRIGAATIAPSPVQASPGGAMLLA